MRAVLFCFLVLLTGCAHKAPKEAGGETKEAPLPVVTTAAVRVGRIAQTLAVSGTLAALRDQEASVSPAASGMIESLTVRTGQTVKRGEIVAQLSPRALSGQIAQAQATVAQNEAQVQQAKVNALQQQAQTRTAIAQAQAGVSGAKATLASAEATLHGDEASADNARQTLVRQQALFADGLVAQKDVEAALLNLRTSQAAAEAQRGAVAAARQTIRSQQDALSGARAAVLTDEAKRKDIQIAARQVENARGALASAQAQRALLTLRAPLDGLVTAVGASAGETVDVSVKLVTITNLDTLQLSLAVPTERARDVQAGQAVSFTVDGLPGARYTAVISHVGAQVDPVSGALTATAIVANPGHRLKDDGAVRAHILLSEHGATLLVPKSAVLVSPGSAPTVVVVDRNNIAHLREVQTGLSEGDTTEVVSGLRSGETVATTGSYGLPDGAHVQSKPAP